MIKQLTKATLYYLLHLFTKALEAGNAGVLAEMFGITKDAAQAIESIRFEKGVSEKAVADALGITPDEYLKFIDAGDGLQISAEGIKSLSKLFGMKPEELAAKMVEGGVSAEGDPPAPPAGDTPPSDPTKSGDKNQKIDPAQKGKLPTAQIIVSKSAPPVGVTTLDKLSEATKEDKRKLLAMSLTGLRSDLSQISKDNIKPGDFAPSGVLQPDFFRGLHRRYSSQRSSEYRSMTLNSISSVCPSVGTTPTVRSCQRRSSILIAIKLTSSSSSRMIRLHSCRMSARISRVTFCRSSSPQRVSR
jgi:hypothetical protein